MTPTEYARWIIKEYPKLVQPESNQYRLAKAFLEVVETLKLYADDASWFYDGSCDANGAGFRGQSHAREALARIEGQDSV